MKTALEAAAAFEGATSPNPPVGAVGVDASGNVLSVGAHVRAGEPHAEQVVIADCRARGIDGQLHTLVVTLEPCNHVGRTPACSEIILSIPSLRRVVYGAGDPNPRVAGGGGERLRAQGLEVIEGVERAGCEKLIRAFSHHTRTGLPWITMKVALDPHGSMIPPTGQKTFTSEASLKLAHELRRRADAILTGSGTVLADSPEFTVRHVPDFTHKRRRLIVMDRRGQVTEKSDWFVLARERGFDVQCEARPLPIILTELGRSGVMELLVEAGPTLSRALQRAGLWNERVTIQSTEGKDDVVQIQYNPAAPLTIAEGNATPNATEDECLPAS